MLDAYELKIELESLRKKVSALQKEVSELRQTESEIKEKKEEIVSLKDELSILIQKRFKIKEHLFDFEYEEKLKEEIDALTLISPHF